MGVRGLDTFIRQEVPGGHVPVNIAAEILTYYLLATDSNPPAPIIVIDLMALYTPLSTHDRKGLLFGGRFNLAYKVIDAFFAKLKNYGVKLEFFQNGPAHDFKTNTWCQRQDSRYKEMLKLIDAVDAGADLDTLLREQVTPLNFRYPLKYLAKKYGEFRVSMEKECDQELAAFATKVNALAVISDDSDFLIYEGPWQYWSTRDLDLVKLTSKRYNREVLRRMLGLQWKQMPLLATLNGNDIMPFEEINKGRGAPIRQRFPWLATLIRHYGLSSDQLLDVDFVLKLVTGREVVNPDLVQRFQQSLDFYKIDFQPDSIKPTEDPVLRILQTEDSAFMYQVWKGAQIDVGFGFVDMRRTDFEHLYAGLQLILILRMAGIILHHQEPQTRSCKIAMKLVHEVPHVVFSVPAIFPTNMELPELPELLSKDPDIHASLVEIKFKLLRWIALDALDHQKLQTVPKSLQMTLFTLFYLRKTGALKLFEADLLLQVAYDVTYETYDLHELEYPDHLSSRPFRLVFMYQKLYSFAWKAFRVVGLDHEEFRDDPPFDGVLFHRRYEDWSEQRGDLEQIREWREIYQSVKPMDEMDGE